MVAVVAMVAACSVRSPLFMTTLSLMDHSLCGTHYTDHAAMGGEEILQRVALFHDPSLHHPSASALVITTKLHRACRDLALPGKARVVMCGRSPILVFGMEIAIRTPIQLWIQLLIDIQL